MKNRENVKEKKKIEERFRGETKVQGGKLFTVQTGQNKDKKKERGQYWEDRGRRKNIIFGVKTWIRTDILTSGITCMKYTDVLEI
jgi:hypothetical protein